MSMIISLVKALVLTIIIEGAAVLLMTKSKEILKYSVYCNLMTNPLLNLIGILFSAVSRSAFILWVIIGEAAVVISEAALYRLFGDIPKKKALFISVTANICSFTAGLILNKLGII